MLDLDLKQHRYNILGSRVSVAELCLYCLVHIYSSGGKMRKSAKWRMYCEEGGTMLAKEYGTLNKFCNDGK